MKKKIMILGASILQLPAIETAVKMGLQVLVLDMNPAAVGFRVPGIEKEIISTIDIPKAVDAAKKHAVNGVMTHASDMPMRTVAAIADELCLVGIDSSTALRATNKAAMRDALKESNVPIPRYYKISSPNELEDAVAKLKGSFVIKPVDNSGSRGIYKLSERASMDEIYRAYKYSVAASRNGNVVVEEYMQGPEVSVETLTIDGECHVIQITDKMTTGAPHFVETGHSQPTQLSSDITKKIKEVAKAANRAIGITSGPSHTEIIVTDGQPKIVELGARLGGDCITTHLVPLSTGVNIVECCIKIALGERPDITPKFSKGSAIRYFHQQNGRISAIDGLEKARSCSGIVDVSIVHGIGEQVTEITDSASRIGFVIAQDSDALSAVHDCENALENIAVRY